MAAYLDSRVTAVYRRLFVYVTPHWRVILVSIVINVSKFTN